MRTARVHITIPDHLIAGARRVGLNLSEVARRALSAELGRLAKLAELDAYLAELEIELGPTGDQERADARAWVDATLGPEPERRSSWPRH